jgi:myo-inositol-hexaphosphate 3-phosphohydrolase
MAQSLIPSHLSFPLLLAAGLVAVLTLAPPAAAQTNPAEVVPIVETDPVPNSGDAADDMAIWIHPTDRSRSTVIGTDKTAPSGGLAVYDLSGEQLFFYAHGDMNNVDVRYGFPLSGKQVALVGVTNRTADTLDFYSVEPSSRALTKVGSVATSPAITRGRGFTMYHSPASGKYYAFVTDFRTNIVEQYELSGETGSVTSTLVRSFDNGDTTEGMVVDDELRTLYVSEEKVGVWRYGAEPEDGVTRTLVDAVITSGGHLTANVKNLAIYYGRNGRGYLIASSQGSSSFQIYERTGGAYLAEFSIRSGGGIDAVRGQDGIDVTNFSLGEAFPHGFFVSQDFSNKPFNQNFKLVPWEAIAQGVAPALIVDTLGDPYQLGALAGPSLAPTPAPGEATVTVTATPRARDTAPKDRSGSEDTSVLIVTAGFALIVGGMFAVSGVLFTMRKLEARRRRR